MNLSEAFKLDQNEFAQVAVKPKKPVLQGGILSRASDVALGLIIPIHSHVALNNVVTDYAATSIRGKLLRLTLAPKLTRQHVSHQYLVGISNVAQRKHADLCSCC